MVHGQRLNPFQLAFDHHARRRKLDVAGLVVKPGRQRALEAHAFNPLDEIHEPVPAAELAVGAHLEAGVALQRHRVLDGAGSTAHSSSALTRAAPRLMDRGRPQQAADDFGLKRGSADAVTGKVLCVCR